MNKDTSEVDKLALEVLEKKKKADCASALLHVKNCQKCQDEIKDDKL